MNTKRMPLRDRLFRRLVLDRETGCLLWTGVVNNHGYGHIKAGGKYGGELYVHRVMYEMFAGPIPEGLSLDHLCRVPNCANVAHLEPVTHSENMQRGWDARGAKTDLRTRERARAASARYRARKKAAA